MLTDDKLRKEYDLLGLDLEEDQETEDHQEGNASNADGSLDGDQKSGSGGTGGGGSNPDTVIGHMASATIACILQNTV